MKPDKSLATVTEGNLEDLGLIHERFGFDEDGLHFLMDMMTSNYSDPILAVIRELSTNAADSHKAAGKGDVPIQVTLPTSLVPQLVVEDNGLGLEPEEARLVFTKYGRSTKRHSDIFNGTLGIGAKSPLAYASSCKVVAVKNGMKSTLIISRDEDGVGAIDQFIEETTDKSGVRVEVPVKQADVARFREKARWLFSFWTSPVLVDGETVSFEDNGLQFEQLTDEVAVKQNGYYNKISYVVMGDVPYRLDDDELAKIVFDQYDPRIRHLQYANPGRQRYRNSKLNYSYVLWVPMGSVKFSPTREDLMMTDKTRKTLKTFQQFAEEMLPCWLSDYAKGLSPDNAVIRWQQGSILYGTFIGWQGIKRPPTKLEVIDKYDFVRQVDFQDFNNFEDLWTSNKQDLWWSYDPSNWTLKDFSKSNKPSILIKGFRHGGLRKDSVRRILEHHMKIHGEISPTKASGTLIAANGPVTNGLFKFKYVYNWSDVLKNSRPRIAKTAKQRISGTYMMYSDGFHPGRANKTDVNWGALSSYKTVRAAVSEVHMIAHIPMSFSAYFSKRNVEFFNPTRPSVYLWSSEKDQDRHWGWSVIKTFAPETQVFVVLKKEKKYFREVYGDLMHFDDYAQKIIEEACSGLSYQEMYYIFYGGRRYREGELKGMRDVRFRRCLEFNPRRDSEVNMLSRVVSIGDFSLNETIKKKNKAQWEIFQAIRERVKKDYPLFRHAAKTDGLVEYINAMHRYRRR